jgi:hypothetical protein
MNSTKVFDKPHVFSCSISVPFCTIWTLINIRARAMCIFLLRFALCRFKSDKSLMARLQFQFLGNGALWSLLIAVSGLQTRLNIMLTETIHSSINFFECLNRRNDNGDNK